MAETRITSAEASDLENAETPFSVDAQHTDGASGQPETEWMNTKWTTYFGYYKDPKTPEITAIIDGRATWTIGKGFKADAETTLLLDTIIGIDKDTFNTILENMIRTMLIGGDSYAEIIRDDEENLINLKPLTPRYIKHIANKKGIIIRYEQWKNGVIHKFTPDKILHFMRNRVADEIHGMGIVEKLKLTLDMKNEAVADNRLISHRFAYPRWIYHLDTDDEKEIAAFKAKADSANVKGENIYVPKDVVVPELMAVAPNASLNLLPWIQYLDNQFYEQGGVPKIIMGGSGEFTEASAKIAYLAFQQSVEEDQLYIEEQVLSQLNIVIELEFPVSLENELLSDEKKDGAENIDPSETTAGQGQ